MKINNKGFVLLETLIVTVFVLTIFTLLYVSVVPLLGEYEKLSYFSDIDTSYKLYHVRSMIYNDANFDSIVNTESYKSIDCSHFNDQNYCINLLQSLSLQNAEMIVVNKYENTKSELLASNISDSLKDYIKYLKTEMEDNVIFLQDNYHTSYLGIAKNLERPTQYSEDPDTSGANPPLLMDGMIPVYYDATGGVWRKADSTNTLKKYMWYSYSKLKWANAVTVREESVSYNQLTDSNGIKTDCNGNCTRDDYTNATNGTIIPMNDINLMLVWIPRYSYTIARDLTLSTPSTGYYGLGSNNTVIPGKIDVKFITKEIKETGYGVYRHSALNDQLYYRTPSSFSFGETELDGYWFSKFEMSNSGTSSYTYNTNSVPFIKPYVRAWSTLDVGTFYTKISTYMNDTNGSTIYGLSSSNYTSDAHLIKNSEWGTVAMLSQSDFGKYANNSYGSTKKEVYINNNSNYMTGYSAGSSDASSDGASVLCPQENNRCYYPYTSSPNGTGASTTGNVYGVYDMNGGSYEFVMAVFSSLENNICGSEICPGISGYDDEKNSGFNGYLAYDNAYKLDGYTWPDEKYYSLFTQTTAGRECGGVCYSEAVSETVLWYNDWNSGGSSEFPQGENPWMRRGGYWGNSTQAGIFAFYRSIGGSAPENTTRPTIVIYSNQ